MNANAIPERLIGAELSLFYERLLFEGWPSGRVLEIGPIKITSLPGWRIQIKAPGILQEWVLLAPCPDLDHLAATRENVITCN